VVEHLPSKLEAPGSNPSTAKKKKKKKSQMMEGINFKGLLPLRSSHFGFIVPSENSEWGKRT
jgi:hypothetical protein